MNEHPVVETAKEEKRKGTITELSTGIRAILKPVPASLMQSVASKIKDPKVPIKYNEEKGREEPDEFDTDYLEALNEANMRRAEASLDTMAMFGIELVDGLPEGDRWIKELRLMEKLGNIDLSNFDLEDEIDREFVYKRYIALGSDDLVKIGRLTGISQEDIESADKSFRR